MPCYKYYIKSIYYSVVISKNRFFKPAATSVARYRIAYLFAHRKADPRCAQAIMLYQNNRASAFDRFTAPVQPCKIIISFQFAVISHCLFPAELIKLFPNRTNGHIQMKLNRIICV